MWLPVFAYPLLQVFALAKSRGFHRFLAALPLGAMTPVIGLTIKAYRNDSNLWPLCLIEASPVACVWIFVTLAIARTTPEQSVKTAPAPSGMNLVNAGLRWILGLGLLGLAGFCVFGFVASFELGALTWYHAAYAAVGTAALSGAIRLPTLTPRFQRALPPRRLLLLSIALFLLAVPVFWLWAHWSP